MLTAEVILIPKHFFNCTTFIETHLIFKLGIPRVVVNGSFVSPARIAGETYYLFRDGCVCVCGGVGMVCLCVCVGGGVGVCTRFAVSVHVLYSAITSPHKGRLQRNSLQTSIGPSRTCMERTLVAFGGRKGVKKSAHTLTVIP